MLRNPREFIIIRGYEIRKLLDIVGYWKTTKDTLMLQTRLNKFIFKQKWSTIKLWRKK